MSGHRAGIRFRLWARAFLLVLVYSSAALFALCEFARWPGMSRNRLASVPAMVYGQAERPYVSRMLLPVVVRSIVELTPVWAKEDLASAVRQSLPQWDTLDWARNYPYEFFVVFLALWLTLVAFAFALRRLAGISLDLTAMPRDAVPILALLALPCTYIYASHIYDFPELLLFTLGLLTIAERRWKLYWPVFVLAVLNKETAILLSLVWVMQARTQLTRARFTSGLALQVVAWSSIRAGIVLLLRDNAGAMVLPHLARNLHVLTNPARFFLFRSIGAFPLVPCGLNILTLSGFAACLLMLRRVPVFLRHAFLGALPIVPAAMVFGYIDEIRAFYSLYPAVILVLSYGAFLTLGYLPAEPVGNEAHRERDGVGPHS